MMENAIHNFSEIVDIRYVKINMKLTKKEKIIEYLRQVKDPHICRYDDFIIESVFPQNGITLTDRVKQHLRMSK